MRIELPPINVPVLDKPLFKVFPAPVRKGVLLCSGALLVELSWDEAEQLEKDIAAARALPDHAAGLVDEQSG